MQIHRWDCHPACRIEEGLILKEFLMSTLLRACPGLCAQYCPCLLGQAMLNCSYGLHMYVVGGALVHRLLGILGLTLPTVKTVSWASPADFPCGFQDAHVTRHRH